MKLLFGKTLLYAVLILICLELITRVFHLYQEQPVFIINDLNVKTYAPNQDGFSVTGNRKMNFAHYHINKSGFNSYREFIPSDDKTDVALIGDSYDFADELHLINAYKDKFQEIDEIIIYMKFENDLKRDSYKPDQYWIDSQYFTFSKIKRKIKLLSYMDDIGALHPFRSLKTKLLSFGNNPNNNVSISNPDEIDSRDLRYLDNFKKIIQTYGFDKNKTAILLDSRTTSKTFLEYSNTMGYRIIDFSERIEKSKRPTTLVYDMHWNNHGRSIIASVIADYIKEKQKTKRL